MHPNAPFKRAITHPNGTVFAYRPGFAPFPGESESFPTGAKVERAFVAPVSAETIGDVSPNADDHISTAASAHINVVNRGSVTSVQRYTSRKIPDKPSEPTNTGVGEKRKYVDDVAKAEPQAAATTSDAAATGVINTKGSAEHGKLKGARSKITGDHSDILESGVHTTGGDQQAWAQGATQVSAPMEMAYGAQYGNMLPANRDAYQEAMLARAAGGHPYEQMPFYPHPDGPLLPSAMWQYQGPSPTQHPYMHVADPTGNAPHSYDLRGYDFNSQEGHAEITAHSYLPAGESPDKAEYGGPWEGGPAGSTGTSLMEAVAARIQASGIVHAKFNDTKRAKKIRAAVAIGWEGLTSPLLPEPEKSDVSSDVSTTPPRPKDHPQIRTFYDEIGNPVSIRIKFIGSTKKLIAGFRKPKQPIFPPEEDAVVPTVTKKHRPRKRFPKKPGRKPKAKPLFFPEGGFEMSGQEVPLMPALVPAIQPPAAPRTISPAVAAEPKAPDPSLSRFRLAMVGDEAAAVWDDV